MRVGYQRVVDLDDLLSSLRDEPPRTIVFDVEPLVTPWDTDQESLVAGVARVIDRVVTDVVGVRVVAFATNSRRRLTIADEHGSVRLLYLTAAAKPFRIAPYRTLPRPGVVVGDQVATDGALAWRLGYSFRHVRPDPVSVPPGPRIMNQLGHLLRPFLFTRPG